MSTHGCASMQRLSFTTALAVIALSGCIHRSPRERILAAFSSETTDPGVFGEPAPQYVGFADPVSARVLGDMMRSGKYRLAPQDRPLLCPGVAEPGNHGYVFGVSVRAVKGDTAFATLAGDCLQFVPKCRSGEVCASMGGAVRHSVDYLLARNNGKWRIVKPLVGAVIIGI
jgi:hypothetical protein